MTDWSAKDQPYKVLLKKGEWVDESRRSLDGAARVVPYKIYHPADYDGGPMPVIIWSHGFGGNANGAAFLSRFLAGQGYCLVHITHHGTDSSLWEGKEGHPWDILKKVAVSRETTLARFMDVPFALDQLPSWAEDHSEIGAYMDLSTLGMSGHSFGAMTSQVMAGQMFPNEHGDLTSYKEDRFKAGILYSPVPIRHLVGEEPEPHIYGPISIPLLHMTGTLDDSPLEGFGYERRLAVHDYSAHPEKYLLVKNGADHMVYNGTRGALGTAEKRERYEDIIRHSALAFWDAQLKGDAAAQSWLTEGGVADYLGGDGEFKAQL